MPPTIMPQPPTGAGGIMPPTIMPQPPAGGAPQPPSLIPQPPAIKPGLDFHFC